MNLDKAQKIIDDWGMAMEEDDGVSFYDSTRLPHARDEIVFALLLGLKFLPDMRGEILSALAALARYQDGVGSEPISPEILSPEDLMGMLKQTASGRRDASETERIIANASESSNVEKITALKQSYEQRRARYFSMADRVL